MTTQLTLLPTRTSPWQLDAGTRAIGHQGLAAARAALAAARPRTADPFRPAPAAGLVDHPAVPAAAAAA